MTGRNAGGSIGRQPHDVIPRTVNARGDCMISHTVAPFVVSSHSVGCQWPTPQPSPPPPERASTPDLAGAGVHGRSLGHLCPSTTIRRRYWAHSPHCRNQPPGGATHAGNSVPLPSAIAAAGVPSMPSPKGRKRDSGSRGRGNVRVGRPFASAPAKTAQNGLSKEGRDRRIHSPGSPEGSVRCGV